jgi:hypothetical protein
VADVADAAAIVAPSGQEITLQEVLLDDAPGALWARFRFIAPQIARGDATVPHETAARDMDHLCAEVAIPYLAALGINPARVVISLADQPVDFGVSDPGTTQFFETYTLDGARCIWEEF